ncbi:MAG: SCO family protein [Gemmatimonadaceae bacterium]|nr:SCO family protein [Gemmatimonadaceae bacterium]
MSIVTGVLLPLVLTGCTPDQQLHGVMVDPPRAIASFDFTLPSGAVLHTAPEAGRPMVVFFGYTHCPDVCPTTLADWKRAKAKLGKDSARVRFVFVSVDPERDTPAVAARYAQQFDPSFMGVSGDSATTSRMMKEFGVAAAREASPDPQSYGVTHSGSSFLLDAQGRLMAMYPLGIGWEALAADLKSVL